MIKVKIVFGMSSLHALSIETVNVSKNEEKSGLFGSEPISALWLSLSISRRLSVFFLENCKIVYIFAFFDPFCGQSSNLIG